MREARGHCRAGQDGKLRTKQKHYVPLVMLDLMLNAALTFSMPRKYFTVSACNCLDTYIDGTMRLTTCSIQEKIALTFCSFFFFMSQVLSQKDGR